MKFKEDSTNSEITYKKMVLLIKGQESKFLSEKQYEVDSIKSSGFKGFIVGDNTFMVIKSPQITSKFYFQLRDVYKISEPIQLDWKIENETIKKNGYNCQKATLNYKGRIWEAWFTKDIPFQEGPYIFKGLPGLIIYMIDKTKSYEFSFNELRKKSDLVDFENIKPKPLEVSKGELKKILLAYYNDPYREMKTGNVKAKFKDENGKDIEPDFRKMTKEMQEYLKQKNNPVELSEAIVYP
ncbi:GLPGLI family protein [Chryseobacterium sp. JUb7]|nr:GLPGLI family protein [Chryseobacterium sp. JUb7]